MEALSTRGTDLGMMARRNFLTARAPHKHIVRGRRGPAFPDVTVLLGDPRLPDSVKKDGGVQSRGSRDR